MIGSLVALMVMVGSSPAVAAPPVVPEWQFSQTRDDCSAYRNTERDFVFLAIRQDGRLVLRGHARDWRLPLDRQVAVVVESSGKKIVGDGFTAQTSGQWQWHGFVTTAPGSALADLTAADAVTLTLAPSFDAAITVTGVAGAAQRLAACAEQIERLPTEQIAIRSPVLTDLTVNPGDLPARPRSSGPIRFRLKVGIDGKPLACELVVPSGSPKFDEKFCALLLKRARFRPAVNAAGQPVEDSYQSSLQL